MTAAEVAQLAVGTRLVDLERTIRAVDAVAYAGATWDWHPLHHDRSYTDELGLPAPVVDGQVLGALMAEQVTRYFGPRSRVRRMSFRFKAMVFAGEAVRVEGAVASVGADDEGIVVRVTHRVVVGDRVVIDGAETELVVRG